MKLSSSKLKQIIKEEVMNETQKALGLPHVFSNFDLAKRIFAAIQEGAPEEMLMGLRNIALNRIKLTRRDIGKGIEPENKTQEDFFLQQAVDEIDKHQQDYDRSYNYSLFDDTSKAELGVPTDGPFAGHPLARRAQQLRRKHKADEYRDKAARGMTESKDDALLYEGDDSVLEHFHGATLEEGGNVCGACLFEQLQEASCGCPNLLAEAEYQGRKVTLNKPMRGDVKKFKVYVKDPKTGNVKKVNFGDKNMKIKKNNPKRRKSFRARHNCDNPGPKTKARYWSCKKW